MPRWGGDGHNAEDCRGAEMSNIISEDQLEFMRERLRAHAVLFDDPAAYEAGVDDALGAVRDLAGLTDERELADSLPRMI